jgi:hypothetical protein
LAFAVDHGPYSRTVIRMGCQGLAGALRWVCGNSHAYPKSYNAIRTLVYGSYNTQHVQITIVISHCERSIGAGSNDAAQVDCRPASGAQTCKEIVVGEHPFEINLPLFYRSSRSCIHQSSNSNSTRLGPSSPILLTSSNPF